MKIVHHPNAPMMGGLINYLHYYPENESRDAVLFLHGNGEIGPLDGSNIKALEKLAGFPKYAKGLRPWGSSITGAVEYPFHIIAPQMPTTSYSLFVKNCTAWMRYNFEFENIIVVGISLGGMAVYDVLKYDYARRVCGMVSICGRGNNFNNIPNMPILRGLAWHGDADTTVSYSSHKNYIDRYNEQHGGADGFIELITLNGVKHNAWDYAFNINPSADLTLAYCLNTFAHFRKPSERTFNDGVLHAKTIMEHTLKSL